MMVRCPQCGTTFDKDANEFCPNPGCGYPSAFILTPEAEPEEPEEMLRRPGEEATAEQPVVPPVVPQPTVVDPTPPTTSFAAPPPPPPKRRRSTGVYIGIGFAVGLVIVVVLILLLNSGGGGTTQGATSGASSGPKTTGSSPASVETPECTTIFFQGSLGQRVLGPCPQAMRGNDVVQLQQRLNLVLEGQRVLVVDGSFGPHTAIAVKEYQQCRGITPASSIVDKATAQRLVSDTAEDSCPTTLHDLGPPHAQSPPSSPSPSPSPSPTDTLQSPSPT